VLPLSACNRLHVHSSHVPISSKLPLFPWVWNTSDIPTDSTQLSIDLTTI
jgi:hypothetical protein